MTADDDLRRCPACGGSVWPDGVSRHMPRADAWAARSEPRAHEPLSGLDALRHEIEATPRAEGLREALQKRFRRHLDDRWPLAGKLMADVDEYVAALAATPPAEGLDEAFHRGVAEEAAMDLLARTDRPE